MMPKRRYNGQSSKMRLPGQPYGDRMAPLFSYQAGRWLTQQLFVCAHYTRLVKHNAMQRLLQQPHGQCGEQKWGDRVQAKSKCTYGANWGSSVTGWRCKRQRDHHLLKSPTIYPQGQVHELHQRGRRPNNDSKWRLPANPTLRQSMGCCGLPEGWNGTSRDQEGD